ncbi:MAG: ABC transporter permease subunit [Clostridia bacterium]|nr:ABC transporter permease subunit [Clostridia bacterium]
MSAIFKREFKTYFTSPIGYVVLAMIYGLSGYYFFMYNLANGYADLSYVFSSVMTLLVLLVLPVLTMRLMSDDKRQKTDQALLTAPVSLTGIVLGKFFAALLLFAIGISIMLVFAVIIATKVTPDWLVVFGNFIGLLLLGAMLIAIGLLISCLTESQFVAALGTFLASFALLMVDSVGSMLSSSTVAVAITDFLSISKRYSTFTGGLMQYDDIIFFVSMTALFLFITVRVLDRKRWN